MNKVKTYFNEAYHELVENVSWPTGKELQSSLSVVLIATLIFALVIYLMDFVFSKGLSIYYHLFE